MGKTAHTWTSSYICPACDLEWETGGHLGACDEDDCPGCGNLHIYPCQSTRDDGYTKKPKPAKGKIKPDPVKIAAPDAFKQLHVERLRKLAEILGEIKQGTFTRNDIIYQFNIIGHLAVTDRIYQVNMVGPAGLAALTPWFNERGLGLCRHYRDVLTTIYTDDALKYPLTGYEALQAFFGLSKRQMDRIFDPSMYTRFDRASEVVKRLDKVIDEIETDTYGLEIPMQELWFKPIAAK